jgi:hypothetical protein
MATAEIFLDSQYLLSVKTSIMPHPIAATYIEYRVYKPQKQVILDCLKKKFCLFHQMILPLANEGFVNLVPIKLTYTGTNVLTQVNNYIKNKINVFLCFVS